MPSLSVALIVTLTPLAYTCLSPTLITLPLNLRPNVILGY
jgi:hypothetical protein